MQTLIGHCIFVSNGCMQPGFPMIVSVPTPLCIFHVFSCRFLLEAGADINWQGQLGGTAIWTAVLVDEVEAVKFLAEVTKKCPHCEQNRLRC